MASLLWKSLLLSVLLLQSLPGSQCHSDQRRLTQNTIIRPPERAEDTHQRHRYGLEKNGFTLGNKNNDLEKSDYPTKVEVGRDDATSAKAEEEEQGSYAMKVFAAVATNILLFFLIFGLSATVELKNLKGQLTNKVAIGTGVAMQFFIMPILGFLSVYMLKDATGFTKPMGIMLLVVTSSPGGSFSNWWCSLFNADLALSVAMTSVSSILSIALLPGNLVLYSWLAYVVAIPPEDGQEVDILEAIDFGAIFISLGVVIGGIVLGMYIGNMYDSPRFHKGANKFGSICGLLLILFSTFLGSGGGGGDTNFFSLPWSFYVGTAFPCVIGLVLANVISRFAKLSPPETVAISIECCYQNTAIAISVAATMFQNPDERTAAISVPLFYGIVEAVLIALYCVFSWKLGWTKAPSNEKLCVVITQTYEIEHSKEEDEEMEEWAKATGVKGWYYGLFIPRDFDNKDEEAETLKNSQEFSTSVRTDLSEKI